MEFVMMEQLRTVYQGGVGEIVEKKSRFIATVRLVESEEEALEVLEAARKKYWDATHNCFAYVIGERRKRSGAVMTGAVGNGGTSDAGCAAGRRDHECDRDRDKIFRRNAAGNRRTGAGLFQGSSGGSGEQQDH